MSDVAQSERRAALEAERESLRHQLAELGHGDTDGPDFDQNFADSSQVTAERGEAEALSGTLKDTLDDVEHALEKLDAGTYGQCESCGKPIADARLEAMPAARFCIECAANRR